MNSSEKDFRFPPAFAKRMKALLGNAWGHFADAHKQPAPVSIRINPEKWRKEFEKELPIERQIPWCEGGFYLKERPRFPDDPLWHAGAYYVQEASSMLIGHVLRQLSLKNPVRALDLGAAPGGKSTLLLDQLPKGSLLLANEPMRPRLAALKENLARWGRANVLVSQHLPAEIAQTQLLFDLILVDAPCSGEGLFRKMPEAGAEWSAKQADFCATRQAGILEDILPALAEGGYLLYATCTFHPAENEQRVEQLIAGGLEEMEITLPEDWGIVRKARGYQCYPHRVKGEGFFFALLRKTGNFPDRLPPRLPKRKSWAPLSRRERTKIEALLPALSSGYELMQNPRHGLFALSAEVAELSLPILEKLRRCRPLFELGRFKKQLFFPSALSALQIGMEKGQNTYPLNRQEALDFLRGHPLPNPRNQRGRLLLSYRGVPIGWGKGVEGRVNVARAYGRA